MQAISSVISDAQKEVSQSRAKRDSFSETVTNMLQQIIDESNGANKNKLHLYRRELSTIGFDPQDSHVYARYTVHSHDNLLVKAGLWPPAATIVVTSGKGADDSLAYVRMGVGCIAAPEYQEKTLYSNENDPSTAGIKEQLARKFEIARQKLHL